MSTYPKADTRAQWFGDDYAGSRMNPNCGCLHTTEGTSWPSYSGGATAPNLTGLPLIREKRIAWRQHYSDEVSARALQNDSGGVETNTANVVQVELIGTCDPGTRDRWKRAGLTPGEDFIYWPDAPEWALREVAEMVADYNRRHGIRIDGPAVWKAYPASYGEANSNRFTFAEWRSFYGWCGHQHIPENSHGDPGALDWPTIERIAKGIVGDQPEPTKPTKPAKPELETRRVKAAHIPMQFSDTPPQMRADAVKVFRRANRRNFWWVTGTEADEKMAAILREAADENGFRFHRARGEWVAVRKEHIKGGWETGYASAVESTEGRGKHSDRGVAWVSFDTADLGRITVGASHFLTDGRKPGQPNYELNERLTRVIGDWGKEHGKDSALVFIGADFNRDDKRTDVFSGQPFTTAADAVGKHPGTGHGPIDGIASYDRDKRVTAVRWDTMTDAEMDLHTDHRFTVAVFEVRELAS